MFRFLLIAIACVSAQSTVTHITATPDTQCTGTDKLVSATVVSDRDACKAQCEATANCEAYAFKDANKKCISCAQDGTPTISSSGWDMHDLTISSTTHTVVALNTKCAYSDKLFNDVSGSMTRDACKAQCEATVDCETYSFKASDGECMGCPGTPTYESHGFSSYSNPTVLRDALTHTTATPDTSCTGDRLFYEGTGTFMTRDTCKTQCEATANCVAYAFKVLGTLAATDGKCMGCAQDAATQTTDGWDMHDLAIPCSVHCSVSTSISSTGVEHPGVIVATHDTTSGHSTIERCYKDPTAAAGCTCDCA
jgi:hypothetical protein